MFSGTEGTAAVVDSIAEDVWESEDELTEPYLTKLRFGIDYICKFVQCICPWRILEQVI